MEDGLYRRKILVVNVDKGPNYCQRVKGTTGLSTSKDAGFGGFVK